MKLSFADGMAIKVDQHLIDTVNAFGVGLEQWEREHIVGYTAKLAQGRPLSNEQGKTLRQIMMRRVKTRSADATGPDANA
jgi:hypothetical protein